MSARHNDQHAVTCAVATAPIAADRGAERAKPLKLELSRIAREARDATGLSQEAFAAAAATKRAHVKSWEDREGSTAIAPRTDHLARAPREYRRHWTRWLAAIDGDVVVTAEPDAHDHGERLHALQLALAGVMGSYTKALADSTVSEAERVEICGELQALIDVATRALVRLAGGQE